MINDMCKVMELEPDTFDGVKGEFDSLAGLILEIAGKIPIRNQEMSYSVPSTRNSSLQVLGKKKFLFKVLSVGKKRIQKVRVKLEE